MTADRPSSLAMIMRALASASVLLSAVVHFQLWAEGMRSVAVVGPAFLLNAVGGLVIAVAMLVWPHWLPLLASVGFGASTLAAFVVSVTVGLFGVHETVSGVPQTLSAVSEIGAIVFAAAALVLERPGRWTRRRPDASSRPGAVTGPR